MALVFKTSYGSFAELPAVGNTDGDLRYVADTGLCYRWDVDTTAWVAYTTVPALVTSDGIGIVGALRGTVLDVPAPSAIDGEAITTGTVDTARLDTGTSAGQVVVLNGSAQLPAVSGELLLNLPAPSGVRLYKELTYDFSVQGGAISTLNLSGGQVPANSLILSFRAHKLTNMSTGNSLAFKAGAVNLDPFGLIATPSALNISKGVDTMQDGVVAVTSATSITMQISGATLTAGKVRFIVEYVPFTP